MEKLFFLEELRSFSLELRETVPGSLKEVSPWMIRMRDFCRACMDTQGIKGEIRDVISLKDRSMFSEAVSWLLCNAAMTFTLSRTGDVYQRLSLIEKMLKEAQGKIKGAWLYDDPQDYDAFLSIASRKVFDADIKTAITEIDPDDSLAILMIDIDRFKEINDKFGHQFGDKVLIYVTNNFKKVTQGKGKVYRYGGEEMVILLPNFSEEEAKALGNRLRNELKSLIFEDYNFKVTISIGIAIYNRQKMNDPQEFISLADKALYMAKNRGRDRVCIYKN